MSARGNSEWGGPEVSQGMVCVRLEHRGLKEQAKELTTCPQGNGRQDLGPGYLETCP